MLCAALLAACGDEQAEFERNTKSYNEGQSYIGTLRIVRDGEEDDTLDVHRVHIEGRECYITSGYHQGGVSCDWSKTEEE